MSDVRLVDSKRGQIHGVCFKIHANMDPKHRDRLAFVKVVSGSVQTKYELPSCEARKKMKFSSPNAFFAEKKQIVDESFPGDIVGLHDTGNFKIGDTLTEGEILEFKGFPVFRRNISGMSTMLTR